MDEQIREAFDQIHATRDQKEQTRAFLERARHRRTAPRRRLGALAACAVLLAVLMGGWWAWFMPTSAVSVESGSGLELELNRFDRVVAVQCEDEGLADRLRGLSYAQALELLLDQLGAVQPPSPCPERRASAAACWRRPSAAPPDMKMSAAVRRGPEMAGVRVTATAMATAGNEIYKFLTNP